MQVSFRKRATNYRARLLKETYKDEASSPPNGKEITENTLEKSH